MIVRSRILALTLAFGLAPTVCRADAFESLQESLAKLVGMASVMNLTDYDYDGPGSLFGYLLDDGARRGMIREFKAGRKYVILGAGDDDVIDLDLWVTPADQPDRPLAIDQDDDASPGVEFVPPRDGRYCVTLRNSRSKGPGFACCVVMVEVEEGRNALRSLAEALDNAMGLARERSFLAKKFPSNGLVIFGGRLSKQQADSVYDLNYEPGDYAVVASGSNSIRDVDLFVTRQDRRGNPAGMNVAKDDQVNNTPTCGFRVAPGSRHCIQLKNYDSTKAGFVFGMVLQDR